MSRRRAGALLLLVAWAAALAASWIVAESRAEWPEPRPGERVVTLRAVDGERLRERDALVAFLDLGPRDARPPVVILHGSPGRKEDLGRLAALLAERRRVVAPDLPGFGRSDPRVPDYSVRAHARYVLQLMDELGVARAHVVGYSMGGGAAIEMTRLDAGRVASLTLLASIGVQELELLGDYRLNRALHGLQLIAVRAVDWLVPHFGSFDRFPLGVGYARNFYDTDQRPLRRALLEHGGPVLILHGASDPLVPVDAAREHARIVPQSELHVLDGGHFLPFTRPAPFAERIHAFTREVDAGRAATRATADPARVARAALPFDASDVPRARGLALAVLFALIALATFVSEDLTCIAAGLLVADGRIGLAAAVGACFAGIVAGDLSLFLVGRLAGSAALGRAPLRLLLSRERVERACRWFERRGLAVILLTRFLPGTRLPTYFAAGLIGTSVPRFAAYFLIAAAAWTPLLVGFAALAGEGAADALAPLRRAGALGLVAAAAALLVLARVALAALSHRGRRRLVGAWRRWTRWEFWPPWLFYAPLVAFVAGLGLRRGRPTLFTAANPGIEDGGFVGESKSAILAALREAGAPVARFALVPAGAPAAERIEAVRALREACGGSWPVVLKPDRGERGKRVAILRSDDEVARYLDGTEEDVVAQEFVPGPEYGLFYARRPDEAHGRLLSVTVKVRPVVVGDGRRTLERLVLDDGRAVALHARYADENAARLESVPAAGERVELVEVGTHARGALFLDGRHLATPALERAVDAMSRRVPGFFFGRFDVRVPSEEALREGRSLAVLELNGVTSEATHIYDPAIGLLSAYRTLFDQWRTAFEIGGLNAQRGHDPAPLGRVVRLALGHVLGTSGRELTRGM